MILGTCLNATVEVHFDNFRVVESISKVNGPERSVSRESEAAAKRTDTAEASKTLSWCQFKRA